MKPLLLTLAAAAVVTGAADASPIREVTYNERQVIDVAVARGVALLIQLPDGELVRFIGSGRGGDCASADDAWCIASPADSNLVFVKAKTRAQGANNLELVTSGARQFSFRLTLGDERGATQRLVVRLPGRGPSTPMSAPADTGASTLPAGAFPRSEARGAAPAVAPARVQARPARLADLPDVPEPELVSERLAALPSIRNTQYTMAIGKGSADIVPSAVFDDGVHTFVRLPGNIEIPAAFHVTSDGQETITNTRMEGDLLVIDRVSRLIRLRQGEQVVSLINEAFDLEGRGTVVNKAGVTVDGVRRELRASAGARK